MSFFKKIKECFTVKNSTFENVDPDQLEKIIMDNNQLTIIDVRTREEFHDGHLPNALNINVQSPLFHSEMKKHEEKKVIIYCRSGGRSSLALSQIGDIKFERLVHLQHGFSAWQRSGKPIVR